MRWGLIRTLAILALIVFAIASIEWVDPPSKNDDRATTNMAALKADYFLEEFKTIRYNISGNPEYVLTGDSLLHYPTTNASELTAPKIELNRRKQATWLLESATGWFYEAEESVQLEGDVSILREAFAGKPEIIITTSEVTVQTKNRTIKSDKKVVVQSEDWTLHSDGFNSNIDTGKLSLLSNVRAHYETTH